MVERLQGATMHLLNLQPRTCTGKGQKAADSGEEAGEEEKVNGCRVTESCRGRDIYYIDNVK